MTPDLIVRRAAEGLHLIPGGLDQAAVIDGETFITTLDTQPEERASFVLNPVGTLVWELADGQHATAVRPDGDPVKLLRHLTVCPPTAIMAMEGKMITISLTVPDKLAARLLPLQDRLTEIIELGLRQVEAKADDASEASQSKLQVLAALSSTGIVTLPRLVIPSQARLRRTPIQAGGQLASEIIIQERGPL